MSEVIKDAQVLLATMRAIDDRLEEGNFAVVREYLEIKAQETNDMDTRMLQGILRACFPARVELGEAYTRMVFFTRQRLIERHGVKEAEELMTGLQ